MKLKSIIIDDEPLARKGLREYIADTDFLELVAEFDNAAHASELVSSAGIQLLFIDIEMPRMASTTFSFFPTLSTR
jgi:YesN/AraC family two-component response regulator